MISCWSAHLTHPYLFLLHFHPPFSPHASPFRLSLLPSRPRLIHLMAVSLTLASSMEQINRGWKRPSINLLMISSFSWTHKCQPSGCLPPPGVITFHISLMLTYLTRENPGNEHMSWLKMKGGEKLLKCLLCLYCKFGFLTVLTPFIVFLNIYIKYAVGCMELLNFT